MRVHVKEQPLQQATTGIGYSANTGPRLTLEQRGAAGRLLDLVLEESSGHTILDRHTLDMVRNAFPLQVKHQLAQSKLQVDLPFSYRME